MHSFIIDCHTHLYPCFNLDKAFSTIFQNLNKIDSFGNNSQLAMVLCERHDCHVFAELEASSNHLLSQWNFNSIIPRRVARVTDLDGNSLFIFAGRQIVTSERLELLCLGVDLNVKDGISFKEGVSAIHKESGIAVLNWALGKWMFSRKAIVESIISSYSAEEIYLGDTSLRPSYTPEPEILSSAIKKGYKVFAGSDPLPFPEEIDLLGTYGIKAQLNDMSDISNLLKKCIDSPSVTYFGSRSGIATVMQRNLKLLAQKHLSQ